MRGNLIYRFGDVLVHGIHIYGNLYGCNSTLLRDENYILSVVRSAAMLSNMNILTTVAHKFGNEHGVSVIAIIAESHISVHTWPEHRYATVDVYTCGIKSDPRAAFLHIARSLDAERVEMYVSDRSLYDTREEHRTLCSNC